VWLPSEDVLFCMPNRADRILSVSVINRTGDCAAPHRQQRRLSELDRPHFATDGGLQQREAQGACAACVVVQHAHDQVARGRTAHLFHIGVLSFTPVTRLLSLPTADLLGAPPPPHPWNNVPVCGCQTMINYIPSVSGMTYTTAWC
jgi:hypothetical protein